MNFIEPRVQKNWYSERRLSFPDFPIKVSIEFMSAHTTFVVFMKVV